MKTPWPVPTMLVALLAACAPATQPPQPHATPLIIRETVAATRLVTIQPEPRTTPFPTPTVAPVALPPTPARPTIEPVAPPPATPRPTVAPIGIPPSGFVPGPKGSPEIFSIEVFVNPPDKATIDEVAILIFNGRQLVHRQVELNSRYCAFGGGDNGADCNVYDFPMRGGRWPSNIKFEHGPHTVQVFASGKLANGASWKFDPPLISEITL